MTNRNRSLCPVKMSRIASSRARLTAAISGVTGYHSFVSCGMGSFL